MAVQPGEQAYFLGRFFRDNQCIPILRSAVVVMLEEPDIVVLEFSCPSITTLGNIIDVHGNRKKLKTKPTTARVRVLSNNVFSESAVQDKLASSGDQTVNERYGTDRPLRASEPLFEERIIASAFLATKVQA